MFSFPMSPRETLFILRNDILERARGSESEREREREREVIKLCVWTGPLPLFPLCVCVYTCKPIISWAVTWP